VEIARAHAPLWETFDEVHTMRSSRAAQYPAPHTQNDKSTQKCRPLPGQPAAARPAHTQTCDEKVETSDGVHGQGHATQTHPQPSVVQELKAALRLSEFQCGSLHVTTESWTDGSTSPRYEYTRECARSATQQGALSPLPRTRSGWLLSQSAYLPNSRKHVTLRTNDAHRQPQPPRRCTPPGGHYGAHNVQRTACLESAAAGGRDQ
jgi:hypothetical protein